MSRVVPHLTPIWSIVLVMACSAAGEQSPARGTSSTGNDNSTTTAGTTGAGGGSGGTRPSEVPSTNGGGLPTAGSANAGGRAGGGMGGAPVGGVAPSGGTASAGSPGASGSGSVAGSGAGSGGSAGGGSVSCEPLGFERPLPISVDDNFQAAGYFGGPNANTAGIVQEDCAVRPAGATVGKCHQFTFQAVALEGNGAYAGVFWQHGTGNWGDKPGLNAAPGATQVTFRAWGAQGGEVVSFSAGGLCSPDATCRDTVCLGDNGGVKLTLTTTPTTYSVSLKGMTYPNGILGGFVWSAATTSLAQKLVFFVDNIQWE